jgi:hypothetical protein
MVISSIANKNISVIFMDIFTFRINSKLHMSSYNGTLRIAVKLKANKKFLKAAILFCVLQKLP